MASYAYHPDFSENEHLHYDEEEQLLSDIEGKFEESMGRLQKSRARRARLLLDAYLEKKVYKDLYDPDLDDTRVSQL